MLAKMQIIQLSRRLSPCWQTQWTTALPDSHPSGRCYPNITPIRSSQFSSLISCKSDPRGRTKWYGVYTDEQYNAQRQSEERARWATSVRILTGNQSQSAWDSSLLDPPALLAGVTVVIISPRKPMSVGTVARACGSFECEDLRIVMPRQESYITRRHAKSASKGAQYILYRAGHYESIQEATSDCDVRIAFTRWAQASSPHVYKVDISGLVDHPAVQRVIAQPLQLTAARGGGGGEVVAARGNSYSVPTSVSSQPSLSEAAATSSGSSDGSDGVPQSSEPPLERDSSSTTSGLSSAAVADVVDNVPAGRPPRVALVFGREELGMSDEEVDSCEVCCSIPIGRLQESLSLSHAVSIALCALYQARLQHLSSSSTLQQAVVPAADPGTRGPGPYTDVPSKVSHSDYSTVTEGAVGGGSGGSRISYTVDASTGAVTGAAVV